MSRDQSSSPNEASVKDGMEKSRLSTFQLRKARAEKKKPRELFLVSFTKNKNDK